MSPNKVQFGENLERKGRLMQRALNKAARTRHEVEPRQSTSPPDAALAAAHTVAGHAASLGGNRGSIGSQSMRADVKQDRHRETRLDGPPIQTRTKGKAGQHMSAPTRAAARPWKRPDAASSGSAAPATREQKGLRKRGTTMCALRCGDTQL